MRAIRPKFSGSCLRSHSSLGAVKPVSARLPVREISRSSPTRSSISAHSAAVRPSFQRIAGRTTSSCASSATRPCICPPRPMPAGSPARSRSRASTACDAVHQSCGSCSAHPGRGVASPYSSSSTASTSPSGPTAMPLVELVPTSSPKLTLLIRGILARRPPTAR